MADPGFPRRRGRQPLSLVQKPIIWHDFCPKLHENERIWTETGADPNIGFSGRVGGGEKHEIYLAAFGGHLFYDLFVQGWEGPWPPRHPTWIRYWIVFF